MKLALPTAAARLLAGVLLACASLAAPAAPSKQWTVTVLPAAPYGGAAIAINNRGDVAGIFRTAQFHGHAAVWINGVRTDLQAGDFARGAANAINERGVVAGTREFAAMTWKDGTVASLGITGDPQDINRSGDVVGSFYPGGQQGWGPRRGFYHSDGVVHDIGLPGSNMAGALAVNDKGVVVGYSRVPSTFIDHAIVWHQGELRDLGTLGGDNSYAVDINNRGVILGSADAPDRSSHMVTWDANGGLLQDYGPRLAGFAINDRGAIIGVQTDTGRQFLLEDGVFTWLIDLPAMRAQGWTSFVANDINDHGWIAGTAFGPDSSGGTPLVLKPR